MNKKFSEQLLSGLERSQRPVLELFDDITEIIGHSWKQASNADNNISTCSVSARDYRFREQWVLRWLMKKLGQAVGFQDRQAKKESKSEPEQQDNTLITDRRTWLLISYLLATIPSAKAQEILIDRKFCPILNSVVDLTLQHSINKFTWTDKSEPSKQSDDENGRPLKRRRLSRDVGEHETAGNQISWLQLARQVLRIATQCSTILSGDYDSDIGQLGTVNFTWADDIDAASTLVGNIIRVAHLVLGDTDELDIQTSTNVLEVTDRWLHLWSKYTSSGRTDSKQDPHASFNSLVLTSALSLLSLRLRVPITPRFEMLERQIAIHTVLPARSMFQKHFAAIRGPRSSSLQDKDIERLAHEIRKVLQPPTNNSSKTYIELDGTILLAIAARLIPRSDVIRRRSEALWFEMFFLSLVQIQLGPFELRKSQHSDKPHSNSSEEQKLEQLIDTFATLDVVPSMSIWSYFNKHYVLANGLNPSYTLVQKVVRLNASVFVDHSEGEDFDLVDSINAQIPLSIVSELYNEKSDVVEILCTLLDEYGKTAQLPKFLELWRTKLEETFHNRTITVSVISDEQRRYVWDDPNLLKAFTAACRQYASPSFCREILDEAGRGLQNLPTIVGPAHQIFAQLTIATQVLKSRLLHSSSQRITTEQLQEIANFVCLALSRSTDYQGNRWKLYDFLATIVQMNSRIDWTHWANSADTTSWLLQHNDIGTNDHKNYKACAALMEQYHHLHCVVATFEAAHVGIETLLNSVIDSVNQLLENVIKKSKSPYTQNTLWDGSVEGIGEVDVFLSACLIRLATMPASWLTTLETPDKLLHNLTKLILNTRSSRLGAGCLASSAENLLRSVIDTPTPDVQAVILQAAVHSDGQRVRRLPGFLRNLFSQRAEKPMKTFSDFLLKHLSEGGAAVEEDFFSDSLALLSAFSTRLPVHLGARSNFRKYLSGLQTPNSDADLMTFICTMQHIENFARMIMKHPQSAEEVGKWRKNILNICKILKKETKLSQSTVGQKLFDRYDGFLFVAIAMQLHDHQSLRQDQKLDRMVNKIESHLCKQALEETYNFLEDFTNLVRILKVTKLLGALLHLANNKFYTNKRTNKIKTVHEKLRASLLKESQNTPSSLEVIVLKWAKVELDRLVTLTQTIFGSFSPTVHLTEKGQRQTKKGDLEVQAILALEPSYLTPDATCAPLVALTATGNKDAFLSKGLSEDSKLLFAVAAIARNVKSETLSKSPEIVKAFGQIANLESALQSWSPVGLILRLELSKIVFEHHPNIINQHIIDTTLSNVTLLTSSATKLTLNLHDNPQNPLPQHIFDRICQILTTILTRHRRRLTGRHHLLLPALQSLLKCLFYPPARQQQHISSTNINASTATIAASKAAFLSSLPHWLNPPTYTSTHTLPATSASKFSRVLQTLCDPSATSARRVRISKRRRHDSSSAAAADLDRQDLNLVDETRLLRRQVAQHTQYLLQTYCQAMLDGWISPDVKEKLTLGLFAVCNATEIEVMRGLNSAMDENQRAIWKDLYAEWTRWGKWNQR